MKMTRNSIALAVAVGTSLTLGAGLAQADTVDSVDPGRFGAGTASAQTSQTAAPVYHNVASPLENQRAQENFNTQLATATAIGSLSGTVAGAGIGCAVGGTPLAVTIVGIPPAVLACLGGAAVGAPVGAVVGTIVAGGPTLAIAGSDLVGTLNAAPGTTRWAETPAS